MSIIEVKHLTKEYRLGSVTSIKDTLRHGLARLAGGQTWERERFKALDDVTFSIEEGEVVGIIGHNGAGKSTLLKHLAHITNPTTGEVVVRGSVAPLIEVGAGVNPELTGRENIYLNGTILGIPKAVIDKKLDEIIEFSELEQFIDTPVKRYSSGMTVKLGFSIATSMDADILIVDEVLAVGDLSFQRKCFDRMESLIREKNRTVLIVSHNMRQVQRLCDRVIFLHQGRVVEDGPASDVINRYYLVSNERILESAAKNSQRITTTGEVEVLEIVVSKIDDKSCSKIVPNDTVGISVQFKCKERLEQPEIIIGIQTTDFIYLAASTTAVIDERRSYEPGIHEISCIYNKLPLKGGVYAVRFAVFSNNGRLIYAGEMLHTFEIVQDFKEFAGADLRLLDVPASWSL